MSILGKARNTVRVLNGIIRHPMNRNRKMGALAGYIRWQIGIRLLGSPIVYEWLPGVRAVVRREDIGMNKNIYHGLHDVNDMAYLLHVTTPQDLFADVGANVGSYTLLACGARGARGYCFEPVPSTYVRLLDNLAINSLQSRVIPMNIGLSDSDGELHFTAHQDTINHVAAAGRAEGNGSTISVPVRSLDSVFSPEQPTIMKIDVEGFEMKVIEGAGKVLSNPNLHSVFMELNGLGSRYGFDDREIVKKMLDYGFQTYEYEPFSRTLRSLNGAINTYENTLFIRNAGEMKERIASAPHISIASTEI